MLIFGSTDEKLYLQNNQTIIGCTHLYKLHKQVFPPRCSRSSAGRDLDILAVTRRNDCRHSQKRLALLAETTGATRRNDWRLLNHQLPFIIEERKMKVGKQKKVIATWQSLLHDRCERITIATNNIEERLGRAETQI